MRNLILIVLALLGAVTAAEYNQYSRCREWRLELALREQGAAGVTRASQRLECLLKRKKAITMISSYGGAACDVYGRPD